MCLACASLIACKAYDIVAVFHQDASARMVRKQLHALSIKSKLVPYHFILYIKYRPRKNIQNDLYAGFLSADCEECDCSTSEENLFGGAVACLSRL